MDNEKLIKELIKQAFIGKPKSGVFFFVPKSRNSEELQILTLEETEADSNTRSLHLRIWHDKVQDWMKNKLGFSWEEILRFEPFANKYEYPFLRGSVNIERRFNTITDVEVIIPDGSPKELLDDVIGVFSLYDVKDKMKVREALLYQPDDRAKELYDDLVGESINV